MSFMHLCLLEKLTLFFVFIINIIMGIHLIWFIVLHEENLHYLVGWYWLTDTSDNTDCKQIMALRLFDANNLVSLCLLA